MAIAIDQFAKSLAVTGIMSADQIKAFYEALPAEERPRDGDAFAKLLVTAGKLTEFQTQHLLAGRAAALIVGEYVLQDRIGAGGMGQVFKARHTRMQRIVALKTMSAAAMKDEAAVRRFQREVRAAARLEHQNIVTAYDAGQAGKTHFLVMQFVDGGDLAQLVKAKGPLPIEQACNFIAQAARGLAYAHTEGVIHRDIKPANLLIDKKGTVKILDMGLARVVEGNDELTGSEQVMGTVDYMSPEQASEAKEADARSDIYSLGCTLWFLLTNRRLFDGDALVARLIKHRDEPPPSLVQAREDAPWSLEQALHKMVAKKAADRFQSMDEVAAALEPFCSRGDASGMGSSVLRDAGLASFLQGMGSQVGGASQLSGGSKLGGGSSGSRPGSAHGLGPGSSGEILPLPSVATAGDSRGGSGLGLRPPSSIHAATATVSGGAFDTDAVPAKSNPRNSVVGRTSNIARPAPAKKNSRPLILGGAAALLVVIGVAVMLSKKSATDPVAIAPVKPSAPPQPAVVAPIVPPVVAPKKVDPTAERRVAQWVMGKGGMVGLAPIGSPSVTEFRDRAPLPSGDWVVRRISLADKRNTGDGELTLLAPLAELESLNLNRAGITHRALPYLSRLTTLKSLELGDANVRDADVDFLIGLTSLTSLVLSGSSVSEDGIAKLRHLPLSRLDVGSIVCGNSLGKVLRNFISLSSLRLDSVGLQTDGLAELSALKNLQTLTLNSLPLSDAGLKIIASWQQLRDVNLGGGSFSPAGIATLAALTDLRRFEIEGVSDAFAPAMVALQQAWPKTEVWLNNNRVAALEFPLPPEPAPAVPHNTLSAAEQSAGWKLLFDGKSFANWKQWRGPAIPAGWWIVDGQLRTDGGGPFLTTVDDYSHFELTFDFRMSPGGNSGLYYHADEAIENPVKSAPELEIVTDNRLGTIYGVGPQTSDARLNPPDAWHRIHVTAAASGSKHEVFGPDGKLLWSRSYLRNSPEVKNSQMLRDSSAFWKNDFGKIVFQSRDRSVAFRNVKLRVLPTDEAEKLVGGGQ